MFPVLAILVVISGIISFTTTGIRLLFWCAWKFSTVLEPNAKIYALKIWLRIIYGLATKIHR